MDEPSIEELQEKQRILGEFLEALNDFITETVRRSDSELERFSIAAGRLKRLLTIDQLVEIDRELAAISRLKRDLVPVIQEAVRANFRLTFLNQYIAGLDDDDRKKDALKLFLLTQLFAIRDQFIVARGSVKIAADTRVLFCKLAI